MLFAKFSNSNRLELRNTTHIASETRFRVIKVSAPGPGRQPTHRSTAPPIAPSHATSYETNNGTQHRAGRKAGQGKLQRQQVENTTIRYLLRYLCKPAFPRARRAQSALQQPAAGYNKPTSHDGRRFNKTGIRGRQAFLGSSRVQSRLSVETARSIVTALTTLHNLCNSRHLAHAFFTLTQNGWGLCNEHICRCQPVSGPLIALNLAYVSGIIALSHKSVSSECRPLPRVFHHLRSEEDGVQRGHGLTGLPHEQNGAPTPWHFSLHSDLERHSLSNILHLGIVISIYYAPAGFKPHPMVSLPAPRQNTDAL
ncbi:hypothetical protein SODALDRAFT_362269 [Sodiomyces alkalinus F11]|uniref:Uncharacterized protein n=1 Tax=Sodiomyces alkalinus (strain CBS 110278 / VKM F-3762 / F11) TaxID=1314773 RepID=A0A3N2PPN0_SODAK|nr:hypothetical protein SODALDRAFT_362269 [Sodiomyces alkalinus F11]ROT36461.1 hypothetical protein SODALDRAFT_362269 [Sodiomyces alkalinus F11]